MNYKAWLAFAALSVIWGFPYFLIKLAVTDVPPLMIAWTRVTLAACILMPLAWRRCALGSLRVYAGPLLVFALAEFVIPFAAISVGEQWIESSVAGILIATVPMWVLLLSRSFGVHERLGARRLMGLTLGFVGVVTLLGFGAIGGPRGWAGVGCMLISALGYAVGPLVIQRHMRELDAIGSLAASLTISSAVLSIPALLVFPGHMPSLISIACVAALGIACTAIAMVLMFYLVNQAGAARATLITYLNPAVASLLGVMLLDEHLGASGLFAFALILLGSWLASRRAAPSLIQAAAEP